MLLFTISLFFKYDLWDNIPMEKKELKIRVHPSIHKRVKLLAAKQEKSINYIMEVAIAEFLAKYENLNYEGIFKEKGDL